MKVHVYKDEWYPAYQIEEDSSSDSNLELTNEEYVFVLKAFNNFNKAQLILHRIEH